ncbi:hypothetical protein [Candidatus Entotheonella palauensis]|uniref:hypothetical protein n=1 Tax=Candidatus Entotheonella palauensis TaxID=93172 RepID=UPI00117816DF|nr:hypothetical protein [Candidatus Entotheonella palauensis]
MLVLMPWGLWAQTPPPPPPPTGVPSSVAAPPPGATPSQAELQAQLDRLKAKREELQAWRDRLIEKQNHLAVASQPATPEQLAAIQQAEEMARQIYAQAVDAQAQMELFKSLPAHIAAAPDLQVDPNQIVIELGTAKTKRSLNVRSLPSVDSDVVARSGPEMRVVVLGRYGDTEWHLVMVEQKMGFIRTSELTGL